MKEVVQSLERLVDELYEFIQTQKNHNMGLLSGYGGIYLLLFLFKESKADKFEKIEIYFFDYVNKALQNPSLNFTDGISGIGWLLEFFCQQGMLKRAGIKTLLKQIDVLSIKFAENCFINNNHDFLYGPLGEAIYLLNRLDQSKIARNCLSNISSQLNDLVLIDNGRIYWSESLFMTPPDYRDREVINLGLSHGLASKVVFLSKLVENKIEIAESVSTLKGCTRFLKSCKSKFSDKSLYPSILTDFTGDNSALRWSYGDLGIGWAFWKAGLALNEKTLKDEAVETYIHAAERLKKGEGGVTETSICRGSAGVANMYRNMYRETGLKEFKDMSYKMIELTLEMMTHEGGFAGIKMLNNTSPLENEHYWEKNPYLLMGAAGVGLVLFSFISKKEYYWDECLLMT